MRRRSQFTRAVLGGTALATAFVAMTSVAFAVDRHVTTAVDGAAGSLRSQIAAANNDDTIIIDPGVNPLVSPALPVGDAGSGISTLGKNLVIQGQGVGQTTISADSGCGAAPTRTRLLNVPSGFVAIAQVTFSGGCGRYAVAGGPLVPDDGGAIYNAGSLNLDRVDFVNNEAGNAIDTAASTAGGYGGAIFNAASGTLVIDHSTISGNRAGHGHRGTFGMNGTTPTNGGIGQNGGWGGGIATDGAVTIANSTISGNFAGTGGQGGTGGNNTGAGPGANGGTGGTGGFGGGISRGHGMTTPGPAVSITNSTISGNQAGAGGNGGTRGIGGTPGNDGPGGQGGNGGGIGRDIQVTLVHDTVAGNIAGADGPPFGGQGGIAGGWDYGASGGSAQNTIIANNAAASFPQFANCDGAVQPTNGGHNIAFPAATGCPGAWGTGNPMLGPLAANGGPTQTRALGAGSAALDQVPNTGAGCAAADQRGIIRPQPTGGLCDIGAFEAPQFALNVATAGSGSGTITGAGINCPPDCTESYPEGTVVPLAANPTGGSTFAGWSGDCTGAACSLTMNAARSVTATFELVPPSGGDGSGAGSGGGSGDGAGTQCRGDAATVLGTAGNDVIAGTPGDDVIVAGEGNDRVRASGGRDRVCGGGGKDKLSGSGGADLLAGEGGRDLLTGGGGKDVLVGGPGADKLRGGGARDRLKGGGGRDSERQ
jgi:hypothetical protein